MPRRGCCVWASHLSLFSLPSLLSVLLSEGRFALCYTAATPLGRFCAWALWTMGGLLSRPRAVSLTRHGERADDPASAVRLIQHGLNQFTDGFFDEHAGIINDIPGLDPRIPREQLLVNLQKVVGLLTYDLLVFVELARYHQARSGAADARLVILSPMAVLAQATHAPWLYDDVAFIAQQSLRHSLLVRFAWETLRILGRVRWTNRAAGARPNSVAVVGDWGLERGRTMNDLFWWWESGIDPRRVVVFFDRPGPPARREFAERAKVLGIRCVALNAQGAGDCPELLWRATVSPAKALALAGTWLKLLGWGLARGPVGAWIAGHLSSTLGQTSLFEEFLVEYGVRAVFHWNDVESDFVSLACQAAGAARIGHQWSNIHWPTAYQARLHHVYFAWGPLHREILEEAGSCTPHIVYSGCIVKGAFPGHGPDPAADAERRAVLAAGAERVLALFDNSLPCEGFYRLFLSQVGHDARWGLLIKPKGRGEMPWSADEAPALQVLFEQALATGRVRVLDPLLSPADAAAAGDLSVGVDMNSATVVAALAGHRAIHLDYTPVHRSPLAKWAVFHEAGLDRVVFNDPDRLWKELNRFFDEPGSLPRLGLADDEVLSRLDPFRDGQAGRCIGEYVRWYLDGLDRGLDRDHALLDSTRRYAGSWGNAMVARGLPTGRSLAEVRSENCGGIEVGAASPRGEGVERKVPA